MKTPTIFCCTLFLVILCSEMLHAMDGNLSSITYNDQGSLPLVPTSIFDAVDIRIGTVTVAEENKKARIPSLRVEMAFGDEFKDLKQSSAQLRDNYLSQTEPVHPQKAPLVDKQIAAIINFPPRSVGIRSYFLTLGVVSLKGETNGTVVVIPLQPVPNGAKVKLLNDNECSINCPRSKEVNPLETFHVLDIRVGTVISVEQKQIDFGELGIFRYSKDYDHLKEGVQVLRAFNLDDLERADNILGVVNEHGERIPVTLERPLPNGRFLK